MIIAAPPNRGDLQPLLQLATALVGKGYAVTTLTGSRLGDRVLATGSRFVPLEGVADLDDHDLPGLAFATTAIDQLNVIGGLLADAIPDEHRQLQELLEADPDAVLITNSLFLGPWAVALGAPGRRPRRWVAVGCNPLSLPSTDTTPTGPVPPGPDGDTAAANRAANDRLEAAREPTRERIEAAVRGLGATSPVPGWLEGSITVPDAFACLTVPGLEFARSDAPASLHLVGALPAPTVAGWTEPAWWPDLAAAREAGRPVVVVTQGTFTNHDLGDLVRPTLDALADEDVLVIATIAQDVDALPGPVPANARVEEFIPYGHLLPHADVLVTNGGFGATQQALAARVPVVVAGETDTKPMVAARVTAAGAGRDLGTATPQPSQVREAVLALLADDEVRGRVQRLAGEYADHDALDAIERLALGEPDLARGTATRRTA